MRDARRRSAGRVAPGVGLPDAERDSLRSFVGIQQTQSPSAGSFCAACFSTADDLIVVEDTLHAPRPM
jgi:hypothetical protein